MVTKELAEYSHSKSGSQCLNVQVDTKDKWQIVFVCDKYWDCRRFTVTKMDSGNKSALSKSADNTELHGTINTP